ncbi:UNVERIFIED_CONTAM: Retrovirus-related Pol polyprotein from transposon RE2 [Sesamum latifolium]|uniref:Retrovirus-related Pol polyprotein from transposon RE2 n=1 Tax=Sesamum latifolium TaxID=2727402 RepID=A0AAW2U4Q5_9LAMI
MRSEMDSMSSNNVWTLVDPPKDFKPIGHKWVYKRKLGADGEVTTFKARLVAKGYTQRPGVDFEKTCSSVVMAKSIRILLVISAYYDYEIWHMDVKMSFLNGFIKEEIYMDQPVGFISIGEEQKVCHLYRSIYGLKQASRSWNICFDEVIKSYDFIKNEFGPSIYKKVSGNSVVFLVLYADNILLIENDAKMLGDMKAWLSMQFSMKNLDDAKSQSDFVFKLNGGVVAWKSSKQDTTVDSTTEAEYKAASEASKEAVRMKNYIQELGVVLSIVEPVVIFCDNNGVIAQVKEPRSHHKSKHILGRYHLL